jgi:hypothetical protein
MKVMENIYYFIFHPQPPKGGSSSELRQDWCADEVPFRACPDFSGGFRGKKSIILIFCLLIALGCFSRDEVEYQNKRIISSLKKFGITGFSQLEEISCNSKIQPEILGKFFRNKSEVSEVKYVFVGRVNSCRAGGCSISGNTIANYESEYFDYFIFFDSAKTVKLVEVYNYAATHGYEITAKGWLKQFIGLTEKDTLLVNKDIDGISGATVSVFAITEDVQKKTKMLKSFN